MTETVKFHIVITAAVPKEQEDEMHKNLHEIAEELNRELNRHHPEANATIVWETKP